MYGAIIIIRSILSMIFMINIGKVIIDREIK